MAKPDKLPKDLFAPMKGRHYESNEDISSPSRSYLQDARRTFFKNKLAVFSVAILLLIGIMSIVGPGMNEFDLDGQDLARAKMPPRIAALEGISWLGFNGTLSDEFEGTTVEEATANAYARYDNQQDFIDIAVLNEGTGATEVKATYHIYEARNMSDQYFWLGTDTLGRDQWTRIWLGTRVSLFIALVAAFIDLVIGVAYGGISGYYGGKLDNVMQRVIEVLSGIPNLVVILLMIIVLGSGITSIILALTITGWIGMARIVRGETMKLRNQEFVMAARTLGTSHGKIIRRHLLPNMTGMIIINTMFTIPSAIFFEAFLSFIGLGLVPPNASLGTLIDMGFKNVNLYTYLLIYPAILISVIMIAFNLIADGLRDAFDPKMHK